MYKGAIRRNCSLCLFWLGLADVQLIHLGSLDPGTKFNSRKEDAQGENYLGIQIYRFYFRCSKCSAEITMKTDPKNSDYTVEHGASRNYEPWRDKDQQAWHWSVEYYSLPVIDQPCHVALP